MKAVEDSTVANERSRVLRYLASGQKLSTVRQLDFQQWLASVQNDFQFEKKIASKLKFARPLLYLHVLNFKNLTHIPDHTWHFQYQV